MSSFRLTKMPRAVQLVLYGVVLLLLLHFVQFSADAAQRTSHGYVVLYTSAQLIREGADVSNFYDDRWFGQQTQRYDALYRDIFRPHSPITALMLLPLSDLDYAKSRVLWIAFNFALLAAASFRLLRELKVRRFSLPLMMALILLYDPLHVNLELGQSYILMFVLLVIAWVGYRRGDDRTLGIALGLMLGLKTAGLFLWVLLLLEHRWRALASGIVTVVLLALLSLPFVGFEAWFTYIREVSYFNGQPWLSVTAYQTPTSLFGHLFNFDAQWNPAPLFNAPFLASILTWTCILGIVGLSVIADVQHNPRQQQYQRDLLFAAFVIVSVVIVPLALDYHYMLLLLPILILVAQQWYTLRSKLLLGLGVALVATSIAYRQPELSTSWRTLLAYPKLYGALLLWGLALWQSGSLTLKNFAVTINPYREKLSSLRRNSLLRRS